MEQRVCSSPAMGCNLHFTLLYGYRTGFQLEIICSFITRCVGFYAYFYLNYAWLIDKLLYKGKTKSFILYNLLLIVIIAFLMHYGRGWIEALIPELRTRRRYRRENLKFLFIVRNSTSLFLMTGLSVALKMTVRWFEVDNERKELAKAKSEAEPQNLKNQINPHFC